MKLSGSYLPSRGATNRWRSLFGGQFKNVLNLILGNKLILLIFVAVVTALIFYLLGFSRGKSSADQTGQIQKVSVEKKFSIANLDFNINSFEITNQAVIDNKPLKAPQGKKFLIVFFYVTNPAKETSNLQSVNLFRLIDAQGHKFAPELYNKVTTVFPDSTKADQVGFLINDDQKKLTLEVGLVNAEKHTIEINIK